MRLVEGVRLVLIERLPLPVIIAGVCVGAATDAVGATPVGVLSKGGLPLGNKGVRVANPLKLPDATPLTEAVNVTLGRAVGVEDMDKEGVGVLIVVLLLVGVFSRDFFEDTEAAPLPEVEGDLEGVSELSSPVGVPPPPPPRAIGVPVPPITAVPLAAAIVAVGVPDQLQAPEAVFCEAVEDTVEVIDTETVGVRELEPVKAGTELVLVGERELEVVGQVVLLAAALPLPPAP